MKSVTNSILWSMYDPLLPAPQKSQVNILMKYGMWFADRVLDNCSSGLQAWAWSYLSKSTSPCPEKGLVTGDFFRLSQVGMFRFLLDKVSQVRQDPTNNASWLHFRIGPIPMMTPLETKSAFEILRSDLVVRGLVYDRLVSFFGYGIFTSRITERWQEQRGIARSLFLHKALIEMAPPMYMGLINEAHYASQAANGKSVDLVLLLSRMGLFAFCDSILGVDVRDIADELAPAVNRVLAYINGALEPITIPFGESYNSFLTNRNLVHDWMRKVIGRVRENNAQGIIPPNPLVKKILKTTDPKKEDELIELMISMVLGGHETTARLMLGALYGLMQHSEYIEEIRDEIELFCKKKENQGLDWRRCPLAEQKKELHRLNTVIDEALRLFPPVWLIARSPIEDIEIDGELIAKGTQVLISFLVLNRLESNWGEDAEAFYPERFDHDKKQEKEFFPFAAGPQRCPGDKFARMEAILAIAGLLNEFDLKMADPNQLPNPTSAGTFRLFQELPVFLMPRSPTNQFNDMTDC